MFFRRKHYVLYDQADGGAVRRHGAYAAVLYGQGAAALHADGGNRRVFNEESVNWMQGIQCLKGCGASIEDIQEYCRLCLLEESEENLRTRYAIIRKQREEAYRRLEEAKATVKYMEDKAAHYEAILAGLAPDDTNPKNWTAGDRPEHETCSFS